MTTRHRSHSKYALTPTQLIAIGFAVVIALGTVLLSLPAAHKAGVPTTFTDNLFTATSAVCITGLLTVDLGSTYTVFGQVVIACLIQIGGLGILMVKKSMDAVRYSYEDGKNILTIQKNIGAAPAGAAGEDKK